MVRLPREPHDPVVTASQAKKNARRRKVESLYDAALRIATSTDSEEERSLARGSAEALDRWVMHLMQGT